jgi:hypothetical protein
MRFQRPDEAPYYLSTGEENPAYDTPLQRWVEALEERPSLGWPAAPRASAHDAPAADRLSRHPSPAREGLSPSSPLAPNSCPVCEGTGRGNPLPPTRYPIPCGACGGSGQRKDEQ